MKTLQNRYLWLLIGALAGMAILFTPGCAWFHPQDLKPVPVAAGQDAVVVNAERVQETSLAVYRELTNWELKWRNSLPVEVSRAVDEVRKSFKPNWKASRAALDEYKRLRGPDATAVQKATAALAAAENAMLGFRKDKDNTSITALFAALTTLTETVRALNHP